MVCFMPWLGKLLTTDVFTTTLTSLQMMGEPGGIRIRGPTRGRCQAARTVSGVRAPTQARAHRPLSPLAPALLVRVFKFETCGFSRSSRAPPPPPPGSAAGGGGAARQPTQSRRLAARPGDVVVPCAHVQPRPAPARTRATACRRSGAGRSAQCPGCPARQRLRPQSAEPQHRSDWAGRGGLGGADAVPRGGAAGDGAGPERMAPCQLH